MAKSRALSEHQRGFSTLEPRIHRVSKAAIRKKWKKLPETTQEKVKSLFESIAQSAVLKSGKERNATEAQALIRGVIYALTKKLPRMPFPPGTEDGAFEYESTLKRNRDLHSQLTANIHSKGLLQIEIEKEEYRLVEDEDELRTLAQGLKDTTAVRKRQSKSLHPMVHSLKAGRERELERPSEESIIRNIHQTSLRSLESDTAVAPLLQQLRNHLVSLQNNTASTRGIVSAIEESQAGLDVLISRRLDQGTGIHSLRQEPT